MATQRPDPRIDTQLGAYRIEAVIGRGGMGVVYRATDTALDRPVALKLIAPGVADDEAFRSRFLRESKMAAAIDHPNIIPIYEAGERDGTYFLAMRYVEGVDLEHRLREGPLEPRAAVAILGQVARALDAAHARGLVHRDVKPANVLLDVAAGDAEGAHAYLTDFGLTKQSGSETGLTRGGGFVGTLEYIAPEQIEGKPADGRADQYALAAIAVACLTGTTPFPRDSDVALINAHLHDAPPSVHLRRAELPIEVDAVVARGMAKDPTERYPDCRAFADALREALGVSATHSRPAPAAPQPRASRVPLLVGGLVVVGVLVAIGAVLAAGGGGPSPSASPSPSVAAAASPSATTEASPTEDVFPNAAEAALLATLPEDLRALCGRGPYNDVESDNFQSTVPQASLSCALDISTGANELVVRQFAFSGLSAGNTGFTTESAISYITAARRIRPGDCATATRASGRWQLGEEDMGAIVCFAEAQTGDAVVYWTYQDHAILAKAVNRRGDQPALYAYFDQIKRFITP